ncbi:restriction endonuclease subunit S [Cyanobium sp. FGCU-52]|nr:restriction endonuclease subunit S [Cyanobium sp. FGCU52]
MEMKPGYKQTEVGVIPEDWEVKTLGEIAHVTSGGTPSRNRPEYWNGEIPWATTSEVNWTTISETSEGITKEGLANSAAKLFPPGTILLALYGQGKTRGKVGILGIEAASNQACAAIILHHGISRDYIFHLLVSQYEQIRRLSNTGNQENLNSSLVRSIQVSLPSSAEQASIAAALDDIDDLLNGISEVIAKRQNMKQAAMQELLTGKRRLPGFEGEWETIRLGNHVKYLKNGTNSRAELRADGRVKYLHYGDIHASSRSFASPHDLPSLPVAKAAGLDRLKDGDLIFADASEDITGVSKSVEIYDSRESEVVSGLHTIAARFEKSVLADGFKGFLQYVPSFSEHLRRLAAGTKVYATNRAHISSAEVQMPPVSEQKAIASVLSEMDAELAALETRRDKTRALKQAMMQELLTGRIRLR